MRIRTWLVIAFVFALIVTPIPPMAKAFSGYASAPLSVSDTALSGGLRVTWSTPTDVDTGITGYQVEYSTSGTSGTWSIAANVSSSTYTYDIMGLSQTATYVRVAATTAAGIGTYGYPWTKIYGTTALNRDSGGNVTYEAGYGLGASDPFTTLNAAAFSRIRWRLETTISGVAKYAEADAYEWVTGDSTKSVSNWGPTVSSIMIPTTSSPYAYSVQANVTDLNVYSDNTNVTKGKGLNGRLEIWPWNYNPGVSGLSGAGLAGTYDVDDTNLLAGSYGSFQVHDMTNSKPVFVWNNTGYAVNPEVAYGANSGTNQDWTFCSQGSPYGSCPKPTSFYLQIFINMPETPLVDSTPPTATRVDAKTLGRNGDTITVKSTELGTVYLVKNTVTVSNFTGINNAVATQKNSVSISAVNTNTTLTTSGLEDGTYNLYAVDLLNNVSSAISATIVMDSTAPTVSTYAVAASGSTVTLTASETLTLASFNASSFTVSDSGSAISITNASVLNQTATLTLSRSIPSGATVYFSYIPSNGVTATRLKDVIGNEMAAITSRTITNNSSTGVSLALSAASSGYKGNTLSISTTVQFAGKVTFTANGKRIAGCIGKSASGTAPITVTCNWKPTTRGNITLAAVFTPLNGSIASGTAPAIYSYIVNRTNNR